MNKLSKTLIAASVMFPSVIYAQFGGTKDLIRSFGGLIKSLIIVVAGLALLAFFWGLVKFIFAQGSEASKVEAKRIMGWGLIALFVMVSVWPIVFFIQRELNLPASSSPFPVSLPFGETIYNP